VPTRTAYVASTHAHACVDQIVRAIERRDRELVMTAKGKVGLFLKLVAPGLVDRLALKAMKTR